MSSSRGVDAGTRGQRLLEAIADGLTEFVHSMASTEAGDPAASPSALHGAIEAVLARLGEALDVHRAYVAEHLQWPGKNPTVHIVHEWVEGDRPPARELFEGRAFTKGFSRELLDSLLDGQCISFSRASLPQEAAQHFAAAKLQSVLAIPIMVGDRCRGILALVDCERERSWSREDQANLRMVASALGLSIDRYRAFRTLQRHLERVRDLYQVVATGPTTTRDQIERVLAVASHHIDHEYALVLRIEPDDVETCEIAYSHGLEGVVSGNRVPLARADYDAAVAARSPSTIPDFIESVARDHPVVTEFGMRSFIGVPVWVDDEPYGAVSFLSRRARSQPFTDADRDFVGLVGRWVGSMLEREAAEERRRVLEEGLHETQKLQSLSVALGGLAHDFSNLIMVITTNLKLADTSLREGDMREVRESLDQAEAAAEQASDLNRQMMTFAGRGRVDMQEVGLDAVAEEMIALVRSVFPREVTLRFESGHQTPTVVADPSQVRQIMLNLLTNASDAMGDEPGVVVVRTGRANLDGGSSAFFVSDDMRPGTYGWIEVEDSGCGMSPHSLGRVFDPFFTTKPDGRGLGLAAVLGIVKRHAGVIDIATREGGPTKIRILLPTC